MNQSLLERERVHEWFQRRTGRAWTSRSVDLTVDVGLVEIRRTNLGEYVHCAGINQKHYCVFDSTVAIVRDVIGYSSFKRSLLFQIECGDDLIGRVGALRRPPKAFGAARRPYQSVDEMTSRLLSRLSHGCEGEFFICSF